jgi:septal ring factor EnvC (AmiA/AmiB activator)
MSMATLSKNTTFIDSIAAELNSLADELYDVESEITNFKFKLMNTQLEVNVIEDKIKVEVAFDSTLSNERQREAAAASERRKSNKWVTATDKQIPELKQSIAELEVKKSLIYRKYTTLTSYLKALGNEEL